LRGRPPPQGWQARRSSSRGRRSGRAR
jgi:hypothetical protein